jgi:hypothetical protein
MRSTILGQSQWHDIRTKFYSGLSSDPLVETCGQTGMTSRFSILFKHIVQGALNNEASGFIKGGTCS